MISQKAKLHNRFDFEIYDTETGKTEYAQAENIVLDRAWWDLASSDPNSLFSRIAIGKGTGTLAPTRTALFDTIADKAATLVERVYDTASTAHVTKSITFTEAEANELWTEVGVRSGNGLVTHALITDSEGNPITVNKTETKIITIYATIFAEVLDGYFAGYDNLILRLLVGEYSTGDFFFSALLKSDGGPSAFAAHTALACTWSGNGGTKTRTTNLSRLVTTAGNYPIRGIFVGGVLNGYGATGLPTATFPQFGYTGAAVGTGDGSNKEFDLPLSFAKPGSETIYVNGTPKVRGTDYTIHYGMISSASALVHVPGVQFLAPGLTYEEVIALPQPSGSESLVTSVELRNHQYRDYGMIAYECSLSVDGTTWVSAGSSEYWNYDQVVTLSGFTPAVYKYLKLKTTARGPYTGGIGYLKVNATSPGKSIEFTSPPANGAVITADFATEYINKTSNFVLDVQAQLLFGEGV